jgi:hypothetical protein
MSEDKNFFVQQWQNKAEGVFLPAEIKLERLLQNLREEERVAHWLAWEKRLLREKRQPVSLSVPRLRFESGERQPAYPAAVVRARPDETLCSLWERGLFMLGPHLFEHQGLNVRWVTPELLHFSPQDAPDSFSDGSIQLMEHAVLRDILNHPQQVEQDAVFLTDERETGCPVQAYSFVRATWPSFDEPEEPRQDEIRNRSAAKISALNRAFKNLVGYGLGHTRFYVLPDFPEQDALLVVAVKDKPLLNFG